MNFITTDLTPLKQRKNLLEKAILSVSGWRKIFSLNGDPEGMGKNISFPDLEFVLVVGEILSEYFISQDYKSLMLGRDSRPTSETIERILYQIIKEKLSCKKGDSTALPEVMAYCKETKNKTGFIYITASHNPSGYNGFKIGNEQGKVLGEKEISPLINQFKKSYLNDKTLSKLLKRFGENFISEKKTPAFAGVTDAKTDETVAKVVAGIHSEKWATGFAEGMNAATQFSKKKFNSSSQLKYQKLTQRVILGGKEDKHQILSSLKKSISTYRPVIAYDFNGSSRIGSIDIDLLKEFAVKTIVLGGEIGSFQHGIVPEGNNLIHLKNLLNESSRQKIIFGISVDCDGDRGNLVLFNRKEKNVAPDAQSTFLLNVLSELAFLELFYPENKKKKAVVGNGPTSSRIKELCGTFDVEFFQSEVGEAHVISLAEQLSKQGYFIRILGEGSNGGNIILPSTVRDPLNSIFSILKLIFLKNKKKDKSILDVVREKLNVNEKIISNHPKYVLTEILSLYQNYKTTPSFSKEGIIKVRSKNQKSLKKNYERLFSNEFEKKKTKLFKRFGITHFEIVNYEGIHTRVGAGNRTRQEDGGFKIRLMGKDKQIAFMWMRSSKTEPVFRIMVDIDGSQSQHDELLKWHLSLLKKADVDE